MRPAVLGVVLVLLFAGLVGPLVAAARAAVADWTFLVYMAADNDLEPVGITDFLEMASVGSTPNVNVVVQFDRSAFFDTSHGDWSSTKRSLARPGRAPAPPQALMDLGEVDMANPTSLVDFVTWAATAYPANHYFLDLWDHGLGWQGILQDGSAFMRTAELGSALAQIKAFLGRNVDIVGNDACRMTLEIMYELQPYVDYFVGSQKDEPLAGWPYDRLLAPVVADPSMTPAQVGAWLAAAYVSSYRDANPPGQYAVTLSLVSSAALPDLVRAFAGFTAELNASVPLLQAEVLQARSVTERYERGGVAGGDEFDLYHFAENVVTGVPDPRLAALAQDLESAIGAAVLANAVWDNPDPINNVRATHAHGLSVWFPDVPADPCVPGPACYPRLALSRDTDWDGFLWSYRSGTPSPLPAYATARAVDGDADGLAERIEVNATPPQNGTLFAALTAGLMTVATHMVPAIKDNETLLNFTPARPGYYNVTVLYYVGGKLADRVTATNLSVQARYRFQGIVKDARGNPVVGPPVPLTNARTGATLVTTNGAGGYAIDAVVPDFFVDGDTLVLAASASDRTASASFVAGVRGTSQTVNLVLDTSGPPNLNVGVLGLAVAGIAIAVALGFIALWQRRQISDLRRRLRNL